MSNTVHTPTRESQNVQSTDTQTLHDAMLATVAYFDIVDYPLTLLELHKWLWRHKTNINTLHDAAENHPHLASTKGFYHLKNRTELVNSRLARYALTEQKIKKLKPYLRYLATLPHIATIMISDSISIYNASDNSDIDIAIITKPRKIWSTRFWAAFPAHILGLRPTIQHNGTINKKDKICLCFYTTTEHLNLKNERITDPDIDFIYWLGSMMPLYDPEDMYTEFIAANEWITAYLPNFTAYKSVSERRVTPAKIPTKFLTRIFSSEKRLKKIQHTILNDRLRTLSQTNDTRVIISDTILKLHMNDRRLDMQKKWEEKMRTLTSKKYHSEQANRVEESQKNHDLLHL